MLPTFPREKALRSKLRDVDGEMQIDVLDPFVVAGDEECLGRPSNLLENAVRHAPEGGTVQVVLRSEGDVALFDVTNSFPPLTPEELERIFDPFYRGSGSTTERTGLGLAITKKIVTLHHGEIGACNTPEGFKVWLRLPIFQAKSPEPSV